MRLSLLMPDSVEVMDMLSASRLPATVSLTTRPHIDLLRTAGALCCS
nr:hypothetical protein OG999_06845 [Streptomyces sp. NBC_00886]